MNSRIHARNAIVTAICIRCRGVFGRTPSRYGPAMQAVARRKNHVSGDLIADTMPCLIDLTSTIVTRPSINQAGRTLDSSASRGDVR